MVERLRSEIHLAEQRLACADEAPDDRRPEVGERRQRAQTQRVPVRAVRAGCGRALGEVDVPPSSCDVADESV